MSLGEGSLAASGLLLDGGTVGDGPFLLVAVGLILSFLTVHILWRVVRTDTSAGEAPDEHHVDGMIVCPNCGEPTETEYRFCRVCAGDTGKGYTGLVESDDSSQSGMF